MTDPSALWDAEVIAPAPDAFRPVQYLGSKVRLLDAIGATLDEVDPDRGHAIDLFSGSGVVAAHLARGRDVTAVDVQEYARVLASALLQPARFPPTRIVDAAAAAARDLADAALEPLIRFEREAVHALQNGDTEPFCELVEHGAPIVFEAGEGPASGRLADALAASSLRSPVTLTRHYGGVYFSYSQTLRLDCLLAAIRALTHGPERDTALAAVLGAASDCVTSVGSHFAQPIRPRDSSGQIKATILHNAARRRQRDPLELFAQRLARYGQLPGPANRVAAQRDDYRAFLADHADDVSVVYADPPYTRDHYSRFYHVLETMALGDEPDVSTVSLGNVTMLSRGLYRRERHQSPFCIRRQVPDAFRALFAGVRAFGVPLVLSYSPTSGGTAARPQPRLLTIPEITVLAKESFADVTVRSGGPIAHSKFNARHLNGDIDGDAEAFVVCRP